MHRTLPHHRLAAFFLAIAALAFAASAAADPPARVGRLSFISGSVSFSPAGEQEWVEARVNRPLIAGDRLWVDSGSRAELQVGTAAIRMGPNTSVTLLNLDDRVLQVQLAQGALNIRVRRFGAGDVVEIDTPNLAYSITQAGQYRVDVDPAGVATTAIVRTGRADVYGERAAYVVNAQEAFRFAGTDLRDFDYLDAPRPDALDSWSNERDARGDRSASSRYVSRDLIGYEDLDGNGTWRTEPGYGSVWVPNRVAAGWTPYRDGNWTWVEPWGWTWVDDAPWGFAVSHYGRWANMRGTWGWVPGPVTSRPVYAPALVAFVGGEKFRPGSSGGGAVGWFPLGPRDVYRPSYAVSRGYFNNVNSGSTRINTTIITNTYNNTNVTNIVYVNQQVPGAVTAVPTTAFTQSQPVARNATRMAPADVTRAPVVALAAIAPVAISLHGGAPTTRIPPAAAQGRPVFAKAPPPPPPVPFAARQRELTANPGKPLAPAELAAATKAAPPPLQAPVRVVTPSQPAIAPPRRGPGPAGMPPAQGAPNGPQGEPPRGPQGEPPRGRPPFDAGRTPRPPEGPKGPQPEAPRGPQPEAPKGPPPAPQNAPVIAPRPPEPARTQPPVNVPRPPDAPRGPPPEAQKGQPPANAPRPPDAPRGPRPEFPREQAPVNVPKPVEPAKAPAMPAEPAKAPQPPVMAPRPSEPARTPPPPANVPKPPEPVKAAPPPVIAPRPPEPVKAAPPPVNVPKPPEAAKGPPPKPEGKPPERRGDKRDDKKGEDEDKKK